MLMPWIVPWGILMKKTYEKPVLIKREKLSHVVALASGPIG
ncbi:putative RiPP precursor [Mesorhizobium sp. CA4]|nr:putative RiPP precursor [Mesorhizobium sp. CA4]MBZ9821107.1 putative RiPP precursor [Mesorhizobium sp. CA4]